MAKKEPEKQNEAYVSPDETNSGRLELTWSNKDRALLAHEDETYEWVPKRDYRVAEVRLLRDAGSVGDVNSDDERASDNLLIRGDALNTLTALARSPEFAGEYAGKIKLCYLDPPFNTGQTFQHYDDGLEHSVWLTMMRDRLMQIKELLAPDGSVWVHLDDVEVAYCRVLMDEIFGRENFVAGIVWQKTYAPKNLEQQISGDHDYILVYSPAGDAWRPNDLPRTEAAVAAYKNPDNDPRGPWKPGDFSVKTDNAKKREDYRYEITLPSGRKIMPPQGRHWWGKPDRLKELVADDRIWFGPKGDNVPALKQFLSEVREGRSAPSWWPYTEVGHNQEAKKEILALFPGIEPFDTPKPERLIERVIHLGSNKGDIVLDCFAGSGTTAAVAHKMGRRWVTSEWDADTIDAFTAPRLKMVVEGNDPGGITSETTLEPVEDLPEGVGPEEARSFTSLLKKFADHEADTENEEKLSPEEKKTIKSYLAGLRKAAKTKKTTSVKWKGGGGFRVLDVAPSMYEDDGGIVVLSDWATSNELAEAVAAQLGFAYEVEQPFCGRHGKMRLAVIDGHADSAAVELLIKSLDDGEKLSLCATSLDPEASGLLAKKRRGSQARVVPQDILLAYRTPSAWRVSVASGKESEVAAKGKEDQEKAA